MGPSAFGTASPEPAWLVWRTLGFLPLVVALAILITVGDVPAQEKAKAVAVPQKGIQLKMRAAPAMAVPVQIVQPEWNDERVDQMIFQNDGTAAGARRRIDSQLALQLDEIDRTCKLTEEQKRKLALAGRGDIKHFFDQCDAVKLKCRSMKDDDEQQMQMQIWQEIRPVQLVFHGGLFGPDSLLHKAIPHTLKPDQAGRYEVQARERRDFRHRASVEQAVLNLEQSVPLRDAQRQELIALFVRETKPLRWSSQYDYLLMMIKISHVPEEKMKANLDPQQWKVFDRQLRQMRQLEPQYRQAGIIPREEDEPVRDAAAPVAPKQ